MTQALGANSRIIIQEEDNGYKGTPLSISTQLIHYMSESLRLSRNLITSTTIRGNRNSTKPALGNKDVAGDIGVELQAYIGLLLKGTFGSVDSADKEISYSSSSAAFTPGETVTGASATATIVWDDTTNDILYLANQTGSFSSENITGGTSGAVATVGGDSSAASTPFYHRFYIGSTLPSFLIEKGFTDINQYFKYQGCKINSMAFSAVPEGFQEVTFGVIGAKETAAGTSYESGTTTDNGKSSFIGFDIATLDEGGSAIANVTTIDGLTIENNLDNSVFVIDPSNPGERAALPAGTVRVSGTLTAMFENLTLYTKAINTTETSLKLKYSLGTGDATDGNEWLEFFIPELIFSPNAPIVEGATGVLVELPFEAYYDNTTEATTTIHAILGNTLSSI